jgi:hypothetical protein
MARIDLEKLAKEYGLHVEKRDFGRYNQWKDAHVAVFLDENHTGCMQLMSGVYPPTDCYVKYPDTENIYIWCELRIEEGKPMLRCRHCVTNDDFNEQYLRGLIENTLDQYKAVKDEKTTGLRHS